MAVQRETLRERAFYLLSRAVARSDPGRLEAWVELGLTMTQLRVLFVLRAEDGASAGALAERLRVTPSPLPRIVDRLVR
ncbi:MAG: MarR family transcriptional regulator, partial [Dehalococcoidia bacterium]